MQSWGAGVIGWVPDPRNGGQLKEQLPDGRDRPTTLHALVVDLLDPDVPVPGVTSGTIRPELRTIAVLANATEAQPMKRTWRLRLVGGTLPAAQA